MVAFLSILLTRFRRFRRQFGQQLRFRRGIAIDRPRRLAHRGLPHRGRGFPQRRMIGPQHLLPSLSHW
jgi:hypothetical protein